MAQGQPSITKTAGGFRKCQRTLGREDQEGMCVYVCAGVWGMWKEKKSLKSRENVLLFQKWAGIWVFAPI